MVYSTDHYVHYCVSEVDLDECSGGTESCSVMFLLVMQYFIIEINFSLVLNPLSYGRPCDLLIFTLLISLIL